MYRYVAVSGRKLVAVSCIVLQGATGTCLDLLQFIAVCCSMVQCVAGNEVLEPPSHPFNIDLLANLNLQEILTSELRQYRHMLTLTHTLTTIYIDTCIYVHTYAYIYM